MIRNPSGIRQNVLLRKNYEKYIYIKGGHAMLKQQGNVSTEWVMVTFFLIAALFVPVNGENSSVVGMLMESLKGFHENSSFLFSLP